MMSECITEVNRWHIYVSLIGSEFDQDGKAFKCFLKSMK